MCYVYVDARYYVLCFLLFLSEMPLHNNIWNKRYLVLEVQIHLRHDGFLNGQILYVIQEILLPWCKKQHTLTIFPFTARTTNTMNVLLTIRWYTNLKKVSHLSIILLFHSIQKMTKKKTCSKQHACLHNLFIPFNTEDGKKENMLQTSLMPG